MPTLRSGLIVVSHLAPLTGPDLIKPLVGSFGARQQAMKQ